MYLPKVTILMTGAGGGHIASAQSLEEAFEDRARVTILNLLDEHAPFPFNRLSASYAPVVAIAPDLYRLAYDVVQTRLGVRLLESGAYELLHWKIAEAITATHPDVVMSVHALLNAVPLRAMRDAGCDVPFVSVVVDAGTPPISWFSRQTDLCCVGDESIRQHAIEAGMDPARVVSTGLPIRRAFGEARHLTRAGARTSLSIDPRRCLVLIAGGGAGMGSLGRLATTVADRLSRCDVRAQIAVIAGSNERLRRRMQRRDWPIPVTTLGFTDRMAWWMAGADVLLSKAGPGTIAEAACLGLPTLLTGFVPGQEEGNAAWAERAGGAVFEPRAGRAADLVTGWLTEQGDTLGAMSDRMRAMGRPDAAGDIADATLGLLDLP